MATRKRSGVPELIKPNLRKYTDWLKNRVNKKVADVVGEFVMPKRIGGVHNPKWVHVPQPNLVGDDGRMMFANREMRRSRLMEQRREARKRRRQLKRQLRRITASSN